MRKNTVSRGMIDILTNVKITVTNIENRDWNIFVFLTKNCIIVPDLSCLMHDNENTYF